MSQLSATSLASDPNLQGYWKMESDFNDFSSNGYNLTANNAPTFPTGKYGNGALFASASSHYASRATTSSANINITGAQTWVGWYKPTSFSSYQQIASLSSSDGSVSRAITASSDGSEHPVYWNIPGLTGNVIATTGVTFNTGQLYHLACVYDPTAGKMRIYVNGQLNNEGNCSGSPTTISDGNFALATRGDVSGVFLLDAQLDDFAIFNRVLDGSEISELYSGSSPSSSTSPSSSVSASPSISSSLSQSATASASVSPSPSRSVSLSPSPSPSLSISLSLSPSPSRSPSRSISLSLSPSPSLSVSLSNSPSPSRSPSLSPSLSNSPTPSSSFSLSPSVSPSSSPSRSPSPSPSPANYEPKYPDVSTNYNNLYSENSPVYANKYSDNTTNYSSKYSDPSTSYSNKYPPVETEYEDKYADFDD